MKKVICIILLFLIMGAFLSDESYVRGYFLKDELSNKNSEELQNSISSKLIRFHVIANSDSVEDQALKLKIRDKVLEYISPRLKNSNSIEESRNIIKKEDKAIRSIAYKTAKENGYNYNVNTSLSTENFPIKSYGNITLPQGEYEAYRIIIGNGKGQNWWCVMFPPLCFVDIAKSETAKKETEIEMKKVLNEKEYELVDSSKDTEINNSKDNNGVIKIKFKLVEIVKDLKNKISNLRKTSNISKKN